MEEIRLNIGGNRKASSVEWLLEGKGVSSDFYMICFLNNKRAQRALGCSPEENVKRHSGAIYSGPLMLSTKYW